jgi:FkbM family methyltransferase
MAYGAYETGEIASLRRIVKRGDTVVDIGANVGYMTAHFAEMVGPTGKIFAFEPGPTALAALLETAESCLYHNIEVVDSAVSNRNGVAVFFETEAAISKGYSRIDRRPSSRFTSIEITVQVLRLDSFFANFDARFLSLVKIDAEGHERQCIEGLLGLLSEGHRPVLMTEVTGHEEGISEFVAIGSLLKPLGYGSFDLSFKPINEKNLGQNFHGNAFWVSSALPNSPEGRVS